VLQTFSTGLSDPLGIGLDKNNILYVADRVQNYVAKYDASGALVGTITSSLFNGPGVILFESDPVSPAVPEPISLILLGISLVGVCKKIK